VTDSEVIYGLVAEFSDPTEFVEAARQVRDRGYKRFEAYTPYAIKALDNIVPGTNFVPLITLIGGLLGSATAWSMEYYIAAIDYPINVGGRPLYSWPSFIPILFELTVLFASGLCFFGTLALCGFPRPHFPLFNLPQFAKASSNRFFLCVESRDPMYDPSLTADFLNTLGPLGVWEVDNS
jgi:Protein of unknown function (DUF3341)